ncbi:MAG: transcription elongation factor GreA [Endomicrobium sp.]|nr:transcription elongation factor GreA [Endomicrobium sp.]
MKIYLTQKGRDKLIEELEMLKKRKETLKEEIAKAREFGDIRENAEYHASKETLSNIINRLDVVENKIRGAEILESKNVDISAVHIGVNVTIQDENNNTYKYTIVDSEEADPTINKISIDSPLTNGLLDHKIGDICTVIVPIGTIKFKILKIEPATLN